MTSLLALVMTCSLGVPALAAGEGSYTMAIQVNGSSNATVQPGSTVTVTLTLSKDNESSFDLYSMQDYVRFDTDHFSYVDGSLTSYTTGEGVPAPVFSASVIDYPGSDGEDNAVYVNRASNSAQALDSGVTVISFQLKAGATGTTTLTHSVTEVFQTTDNLYDTTCQDATVTISNSAVTPDPDPEPEPEPSPEPSQPGGSKPSRPSQPSTDPDDDSQDDENDDPLAGFIDVPDNAWYRPAVEYVCSHGLMTGTSSITFSPSAVTDRAMLVTILYRLDGSPAVSQAAPFPDVPADIWYTDAVAWAAANGIVEGYGNGNFGPTDPVTREQVATILYRYIDYRGGDTSALSSLDGYIDEADVSAWAERALEWAVGNRIINGTDTKALLPGGQASRAETAQILMGLCQQVLE